MGDAASKLITARRWRFGKRKFHWLPSGVIVLVIRKSVERWEEGDVRPCNYPATESEYNSEAKWLVTSVPEKTENYKVGKSGYESKRQAEGVRAFLKAGG